MIQVEIDDDDKITLPENFLRHLGVLGEEAELSVEFLDDKTIRIQKLTSSELPKSL